MPYYVVEKTMEALNKRGKSMHDANLLVLGVAYKKDVDDMRESPSLKLIELFQHRGARVDYHDPFFPKIPKLRRYRLNMRSINITAKKVAGYDAVVIATDHSVYDYQWIYRHAKLIIDTRNAMGKSLSDKKVVKA